MSCYTELSFFKRSIPHKEKKILKHPWESTIKPALAHKIKYVHNTVKNSTYVAPKQDTHPKVKERVKYTVIGNRIAKEFIYCTKLVRGLYKYRPACFEAPVIRALTTCEWPGVLNQLRIQHGGLAYCLKSQVAIIVGDKFLGGEGELREEVRKRYNYEIYPNYDKEASANLVSYLKGLERPCAYLHISINDVHVGTMIFMLYSDLVPETCENFLRLCRNTRGGYSGTPVHRIVKDCWIQCGGYGLKSTDLSCENFIVPHDRRGVLGMANNGRHVNCSTQFFVLLQPSVWMAHKYVAFGQLIEGDETLQKIEAVNTWYEFPESKIIIYRAGCLNLDEQDLVGAVDPKEYLASHIVDLTEFGEHMFEDLMENVYKAISYLETGLSVEEEEGPSGDIHATKRFMHHNPQKRVYIEEFEPEEQQPENEEEVAEEAELYQHMSLAGSLAIKTPKPFYLPLTDVLYPEETDSQFNLVKFLKGNYCLEEDLKTNKPVKHIVLATRFESEVCIGDDHSQISSDDFGMDSEDEIELKRYLKLNADRVSFAGGVVKGIARAAARPGKLNLFEDVRRSDMVVEDEVPERKSIPEEDRTSQRQPSTEVKAKEDTLNLCSWQATRPSAFAHLFSNVAYDKAPTLHGQTNGKPHKTAILLHPSHKIENKTESNVFTRSNLKHGIDSFERVLNLCHGDRAAHRISSDYVKTIDHVEHKFAKSIRTMEFAKIRPSITVEQYQKANRKYNENLKMDDELMDGIRTRSLRKLSYLPPDMIPLMTCSTSDI